MEKNSDTFFASVNVLVYLAGPVTKNIPQYLFKAIHLVLTCVCVCTMELLPSARCPRHTSGYGSTILCCEYQLGAFCQVPSSPYLKMLYITSKDENFSRQLTGEKTIRYNVLHEKMIYILIQDISRSWPKADK